MIEGWESISTDEGPLLYDVKLWCEQCLCCGTVYLPIHYSEWESL